CKLVQSLWKTVRRFLKKLKIKLPCDSAIALLGIYPRNTGVLMHRGHVYPNVYSSAFNKSQLRKERKCPSTDEWIKMWFIYSTECYLAMRKNEIMPFATMWMELVSIMLNE
ncbi:LORF2 protein, partial [Crocuta crocuta]